MAETMIRVFAVIGALAVLGWMALAALVISVCQKDEFPDDDQE